MCSKSVSHVNMWSREGVQSTESVSLPFLACSAAQEAVAFSIFWVAVEGFWLKKANCDDALSSARVLCLVVLVVVNFLVFFTSLLCR